MNIGLVVPGFSVSEEDWCIPALLDLVRTLADEHDVRVFTLRHPPHRRSYEVYGARVEALGGGTSAGLRRIPLIARAIAGVVGQGRRRRFHVLHGIWADEPGFVAVGAGRILGVPAVVSVAGGELIGLPDIGYGGRLGRLNGWLTRRAFDGARTVIVGSELLKGPAREHGAKDPVRLPLGVDLIRFAPPPAGRLGGPEEAATPPAFEARTGSPSALDAEAVRILTVGSLTSVKDHGTLLEAFDRVARDRSGVSLEIAGDGPLRDPLERECERLGIADRVVFHGPVPHDRLPELYRASDIFVMSSRFESQCLAALEAAACGVPVIGTGVGVIPELAPPEYLASVADPDGLGAAILGLIDDPPLRERLGRRQAEAVRARYGLEDSVAGLVSLYRDIATMKPASSQKSR